MYHLLLGLDFDSTFYSWGEFLNYLSGVPIYVNFCLYVKFKIQKRDQPRSIKFVTFLYIGICRWIPPVFFILDYFYL